MRFYIDPGTGSMLFTILVGVLSAGIYAMRGAIMKVRFLLSSGNQKVEDEGKMPFAIFSDSKRYWNTFKPICDAFEKRGQQVVYMTASPDDPALDEDYKHVKCEFIGEGNRAFAKLNLLRADVMLSTTPGLDVYQWKRSKDVNWYAHVLHAPNDVTVYRMFGLDYYDAVLLSGSYQEKQVREMERLRNLPAKETPVVGLPYMDELYKKIQNAPAVPAHETTVLLAPSWGPSSIFNCYGGKIFDALLKTGYHIIVRPHPQSYESEKALLDSLMKEYPNSDQLEWNRDNDNFAVLQKSDILISDFSGVTFDFALAFDKPIIYADTSFDKAPYDACWLEDEMWTFTTLPKIGKQLRADALDQVKELIDDCLTDPQYQQARETARQETWEHRGESAERIVDYLIEKREQICAKNTKAESKK